MEFAKDGSIARYCQANAVMTMKEYLCDYASPATKEAGERVIANEIPKICHEKMRIACEKRIIRIEVGQRDYRLCTVAFQARTPPEEKFFRRRLRVKGANRLRSGCRVLF